MAKFILPLWPAVSPRIFLVPGECIVSTGTKTRRLPVYVHHRDAKAQRTVPDSFLPGLARKQGREKVDKVS
jgi:hypothetical protein